MIKKSIMTLLLAGCLIVAPVYGQEGVPDAEKDQDFSYLEDMTIKDLRALDAAIHELLGDSPASEPDEETTEEEIDEEETAEEPVLMKEEDFFDDILQAYNGRQDYNNKFTDSDLAMMSYEEDVLHDKEVVSKEIWFADKYRNAVFEDLNIQYLCREYVRGLDKQMQACVKYLASNQTADDYDQKYNEWQSGYYNRCYVIVELSDYYDVPFPEKNVSSMREAVQDLDANNEAETRNSAVPKETVKEVQTLLDEIGFKCSTIDGVAGKKTVKAIKRFQEMYGFDVDGMITDELIEELNQVKAEKGLVEETQEETEAATEETTEG